MTLDERSKTVIFRSINEMRYYTKSHCPPGTMSNQGCPNPNMDCQCCWDLRYNIEFEIKSDKEESVEMTNETKVTYADCVYEVIKDECEGMDAIYEDYIVSLVGNCGLAALKRAGLVEGCGSINFRPLYVLVDKKGEME